MPAVSASSSCRARCILLIFAYGGYEVTGVLAGEAANPRRDVPFAFVATLIIVSIVMSLTSLVATGVLPDLGASRTPLADGAAIFLGAAGALLVSIGSAVSMTGNNMGQILNGSRTIFALAENGDLPKLVRAGCTRHTRRRPTPSCSRAVVALTSRSPARSSRWPRSARSPGW